MQKGFTLLELLVVVLIIGILASIALPQYGNAVRKARVAEAQITMRAIIDATDRYFLQHGDFSFDHSSLEGLDVDISKESDNWKIYIDECSIGGCMIFAEPKWEEGCYDIEYAGKMYNGGGTECWQCGKFVCWANDECQTICKQLGGKEIEDSDGEYFEL